MQSLASVNSAFAGTGVVARAAARRAAAARVNVQASFFKTSTATKVRVEAVRRTPPRGFGPSMLDRASAPLNCLAGGI